MAIQNIRLALKNDKSLQASVQDGGAINPTYSQVQQEDQPQILFEINTLPHENGIKAATVLPQSVNYNFLTNMSDAVVLHSEIATDVNDNAGTIVLQIDSFTGESRDFYMRPAAFNVGSSLTRFMSSVFNGDYYLHKRTTLFQNRTVFLSVAGDTPRVTTSGSGNNGFYEFNFADSSLTYFGFNGTNVNSNKVQGITSHENYLVLFNKDTVYWSSPIDPTDFTPALGGGGQAKIAEARGAIITLIPYFNGIMVYCAENIVSMTFSGDTNNPWIFREVPNSAGLFISNNNFHSVPLVCNNEQQQVQYAMLSSGLYAIAENGAQALPDVIAEYIGSNYVEEKEPLKSVIEYVTIGSNEIATTKLQNMFTFGAWIFFIIGEAGVQSDLNRVIVYNTLTRSFGTIKGNWRSMHKQVTTDALNSSNTDALQAKPRVIPESYVLTEFNGGIECTPRTLNLQTRGNSQPPEDSNEDLATAEVLVGPIKITGERNTVLQTVSFGVNDYLGTNEDRLRVYAFDTSTQTNDTPVEFTYNPADNRYYGYIEGKSIKVLLVGKNFYLTTMELGTEIGGLF